MTLFSPSNIRMWSMLGTAGTFGAAALELPELNDKTLVLTADLRNFSGLDRFAAKFPDRLINVGIAEQNLVGIAGGLANEGFNVFATTYATFASTRSADPVRVDMGYMSLGVKLVGLASGFSVGLLGATHMSIEDTAIMRSIPNITVISPADCTETVKAVHALSNFNRPVYLRLGGGVPHPIVYREDYEFEIGKAIQLSEGTDICIVATGSVVSQSLEAAEILRKSGFSVGVVDMHTIKPLDTELLDSVLKSSSVVVTVEEHNVIGGLGSAVAEHKTKLSSSPPHLILGINDYFPHAGDYSYLVHEVGLTAPQIAASIDQFARLSK
jgi:transketolase